MVDKLQLLSVVEKRLARMAPGECLDIRSYKRDRQILILKKEEDELLVIENGFIQQRYVIPVAGLKKLMKVLIRREFQRSNKIRIYTKENWSEEGRTARKKI